MTLHQFEFDFTHSHPRRRCAEASGPARYIRREYGVRERWAGTVAELAGFDQGRRHHD